MDKITLYNKALRALGETKVLAEENREPKRVLDDIWDSGFVNTCLEAGQWNFATRTAQWDYTPSIEPPFGYRYAFQLPIDMVRMVAIASDEYFKNVLTEYAPEANFIFSDLESLYIKYISNDNAYGNNMALWTPSFINFAALALAYEAAPRITNNKANTADILAKMQSALLDAQAKNGMARPTTYFPTGDWVSSRRGSYRYNWRRG